MPTGLTFEQWFKQLDNIISKKFGVGCDDLADWCYMDAYEDGLTPQEAFETMQEEECFE